MRTMKDAWLAAMIEGEGTVDLRRTPQGYHTPRILVTSTSVETIATCLRFAGCGRVNMHRDDRKPSYKTAWRWSVTRQDDVRKVLTRCVNGLTDKRERALELLAWLDSR